jgi:nucleoside-diphosphate-sugar epimerase
MKKSDKKQLVALVTGSTGFVGSHLVCRLVRDGWKVHIISRNESLLPDFPEFSQTIHHIHDGSTQGMVDCVSQVQPDMVFHLASLFLSQHSTKDVEPLALSNVLFGNQLLEAMKVNKINLIINTGTSWQHYNNDDYNPVCLYAATKQAFESILEYYVQACEIKAITLKLFDTYGPNDSRHKLFHLLEKASETGEPLNMSRGEQLIDIVHIDDVSDAYLLAAQRLFANQVSTHECYAISSGSALPLKDLVNLYQYITKNNLVVNWGARPYRFREVMTPWSKGVAFPNWNPKVLLKNGLVTSLSAKAVKSIQSS